MFLTEQNGTQMWAKMLKENFNVTDQEKLNWVSQYAAIHEIHESMTGGAGTPNAGNVFAQNYATPLNTIGMGNPLMPQGDAGVAGKFGDQTPGSGDIPVSTLPMALNVALLTIGLELLPVIPAKAPWALLTYMDFPYAGGKLGAGKAVSGNVTTLDGCGANHPLYVKVNKEILSSGELVLVAGAEGAAGTKLVLKQYGRMDGKAICRVEGDAINSTNVSFRKLVQDAAGEGVDTGLDFVQTSVDFIDGYSNFFDGEKRPMSRAENETGTGNTLGLRLFSKWIQMGSYEVTGTVTRQQLQDLPLYGTDAQAKIMEAMQNELTQSINARILEHVFALGTRNAINQFNYQNVNLNLYIGTKASTTIVNPKYYADAAGDADALLTVRNAEVSSSAENLATRQRRVASRILAAANLIQVIGRRGRATWAVMSGQMITALQDCSSYVVAPMANNLAQDGSQNLFMSGTLAGLKIYVDPYMEWNDTRICVGRKGNGNEPGAIFMPYILADTVTITAEGTMAPKMLVNSRFAIADAGFYPETQYYTFCVENDYGWL